MKKLLFLLILLIITGAFVKAEKVKTVEQLLRPYQVAVDDGQIYIVDGHSIFIYSINDLAFKKKFGKAGEGPQEFRVQRNSLLVDVAAKNIVVHSIKRISIFTKEGGFIKELNVPFGFGITPMGNGYVGYQYINRKDRPHDKWVGIKLYNGELNEVREIHRMEGRYQRGKGYRMFSEPHLFRVYKDRVFVGGSNNFKIDLFDPEGKKRLSISQDYQRLEVKEEHKQEVIGHIETAPRYNKIRDFFKSVLRFPDTFPAIWDFHVSDDQLYVLTYKRRGDDSQYFVFDMKGRLLKKDFVPIVIENFYRNPYPLTIVKGKLYQLIENEDEEWELHVHNL